MTRNQILYQELQQTKRRDEVNAEVARGNLAETVRHNTRVEMETQRHNLVTERQTNTQIQIAGYNAESQRISARASSAQAAAAMQNANTNVRMADIAQQNADTNRYDAETRRLIGEQQAALYEAEANIKANEALNWGHTYTVEMWNKEAQTEWYDAQRRTAEQNANTNERRANNDTARLVIERILAASNISVNDARISNYDADTAYKLVQSNYTKNKNVREWINTVFGSLESFTRAWNNASSKDGLLTKLLAVIG